MLDSKKAERRGQKIINKLTEAEMSSLQKQIYYSDKYTDDEYEYSYDEQDSGPPDALPPFRQERTPSAHFPDSFIRQNRKKHVLLPKEIAKLVPKTHLMTETEWRSIGVQQSQGWVHYMRHDPEPHVLLFRRKLPDK